jgi:hypothetical protein
MLKGFKDNEELLIGRMPRICSILGRSKRHTPKIEEWGEKLYLKNMLKFINSILQDLFYLKIKETKNRSGKYYMDNIDMFKFNNHLLFEREQRTRPEPREIRERKLPEIKEDPELPEQKELIESFQSKMLVYTELKARQLKFLRYEATKDIKKTGVRLYPTEEYLQSYMEQMRATMSNHEWATVLSNRKSTTYKSEKTKIDLLFP